VIVDTLRATDSAQQTWGDVPALTTFGDNCHRLFVVAREHSNYQGTTFCLKRHTIPDPELQHLGMGSHVVQEFQPLDNTVVKINQFKLR
jgi:hypothetical protein